MLKLTDIGEVIAKRELTLDGTKNVTVLIGKPQCFPEPTGWICAYRKIGIGVGRVKNAYGGDSVHALILALSMVGAELYCSGEYEAVRLTWDCGSIKGNLGFPVPPNIHDVLPASEREAAESGGHELKAAVAETAIGHFKDQIGSCRDARKVDPMMQLKNVGEVIAMRELTLDKDDRVTVLIGKPQQMPGSDDWYCPHQKLGIESNRVKYAIGVDPLQALLLGLSMAGAELYTSAEYEAGRLSWDCGAVKGDLGFPVPPGIQDIIPAGAGGTPPQPEK